MKKQHTYGIFESEADHLIELFLRHSPLAEVRAAGCPVCGSGITVAFADDGRGFAISCEGRPLHVTTHQDIADLPPWWRECVVEPTDATWDWRADHTIDAAGNLMASSRGCGAARILHSARTNPPGPSRRSPRHCHVHIRHRRRHHPPTAPPHLHPLQLVHRRG